MKLLTVRVDDDLHAAFLAAAGHHDVTGSQLVRRWLREYVAECGQADLFKSSRAKKKVKADGK